MTTPQANTEALLQAAHIGHAVAALLDASRESHNDAAVSARTLAQKLADQAMLLATPAVTVTGDLSLLQDYLAADVARGVIDHSVRSHVRPDGAVVFYIHPKDTSGDTAEFTLIGGGISLPKPPSSR